MYSLEEAAGWRHYQSKSSVSVATSLFFTCFEVELLLLHVLNSFISSLLLSWCEFSVVAWLLGFARSGLLLWSFCCLSQVSFKLVLFIRFSMNLTLPNCQSCD